MPLPVEYSGANGTLLVPASAIEANHFMLDRVLRRAGLNREQFGMHIGVDGLVQYLQQNPHFKTIIPLGAEPLTRLLGETDIERWRGRPVQLPSYGNVWCVPSLAPSDLLPKRKDPKSRKKPLISPPRFTRVVINDFWKSIEIAKDGFERRADRDYTYDPSPQQFWNWIRDFQQWHIAHPDCFLSWDIETPYKKKNTDEGEWEESEIDGTILRVSFSYKPYHAITMPWPGPMLDGVQWLLASTCNKVVWNGTTFDVPIVTAAGMTVNGRIFDFMDGWHLFQSDLPKGLEFVTSMYTDLLPWKHLNNADPQLYSCIDADAALRNAEGIKEDLISTGQWGTYMRHSVLLMPILVRAGVHGNKVDETARVAMEAELVAEQDKLNLKVQENVFDELRPKKRYKKIPKGDLKLPDGRFRKFVKVLAWGKVKVCSVCKAEGVKKTDHFKGGKKNPCKLAGAEILTVFMGVEEWDELLDFNPNSSDQMIAYMRHFGHPVGKKQSDDGDEEKDSADKKHLQKLVKKYGHKHPLYALALEASLISKALGTYVRGLAPDDKGLIHTTYVNSTSTWRLGSRNVNVQNQGKRSGNKYAKRSRRLIVARPGHKLVQADSSSIEAVYVGHEMGDRDYIDLAKSGIHAWLCCKKLGLGFTKQNIEIIKTQHKDLYDQLKVTNHMTNYGGTPPILVEQFPDIFPTIKSAKEIQQFIFDQLPQLPTWHHSLRVRAQKETFLETAWKHRHYFYDVFTKSWDGKIKLGKDAKRAIAFVPQNSAGSFMRDNLLIMGTSRDEVTEFHPWVPDELHGLLYSGAWAQYMPAIVSVHDGYTLDVPEHLVGEAADYLEALLTRPVEELGGLRVGCEIEVGDNWLDMTSIRKVAA